MVRATDKNGLQSNNLYSIILIELYILRSVSNTIISAIDLGGALWPVQTVGVNFFLPSFWGEIQAALMNSIQSTVHCIQYIEV